MVNTFFYGLSELNLNLNDNRNTYEAQQYRSDGGSIKRLPFMAGDNWNSNGPSDGF